MATPKRPASDPSGKPGSNHRRNGAPQPTRKNYPVKTGSVPRNKG